MVEKTLHVVLGDQLSPSLSCLEDIDPKTGVIFMMEVMDEASYVPHHPKKIALLFSAMRHFAEERRAEGYHVEYVKIDSKRSCDSFTETLKYYLAKHTIDQVIVTEPGEWRVLEEMKAWESELGVPVSIRPDTRFLCSIEEFREFAADKKSLRMETFYRWMRKRSGLLMDGKQPTEGVWNTDKDNRQPLKDEVELPESLEFKHDAITREVLKLVEARFKDNFGDLRPFEFATTRDEALQALRHFVKHALPQFGPYQDAMQEGEYLLFHSGLSPYLNCGLLLPSEVCAAAERAYRKGAVPLQSAEGFIRQILGWREFVRGIYWLHMPKYAQRNQMRAQRSLPKLFWGGDTKMNCLKQVVRQTKETATSHHIQRLMVTGNFALLAGLDPKEVCEWYLAVYADAYEWVELPNTLGMALYGDGGIVGSKPYASSGSYINRMSNFCKGCVFNVKEKTGEDACPFNYLYWDFFLRHEKQLADNARLAFPYRHISKMDDKQKNEIRRSARDFLANLESD